MDIWKSSQGAAVGVSENVYMAVTLALIAHRSIVLRSDNWGRTIHDVVWSLRQCWGLNSFTVLQCHSGMSPSELSYLIAGAEERNEDNSVCVLVGLDLLDEESQRMLIPWMKKRKRVVVGLISLATTDKDTDGSKYSPLTPLLVREFWISQNHKTADNTANTADTSSTRPSGSTGQSYSYDNIPVADKSNTDTLRVLQRRLMETTMVPEMHRYVYDIIIHLRAHRCVYRGIPTAIIPELHVLCKALSALFGRDFVIPTIVKLAVRKLIPLHLILMPPEHEPTLIYGSDIELVKELMKRVTPEIVVEDVLRKVSVPL
jgi:hypothetical protein